MAVEHSVCFSKNKTNYLLQEILSNPVPKINSFKCISRVSWLLKGQTCFYENEKVNVNFNKKPDNRRISIGGWMIIKKALQQIENFKSSDFDYKKYCQLRHIYAQIFLKENEFGKLTLPGKPIDVNSPLPDQPKGFKVYL